MSWVLRISIMTGALFFGGCATLAASANPVDYKTFGDAETIAARQKDVTDRFAQVRKNPPLDKLAAVKVLQDAVPDGIEIKDGGISIKEGAPFRLIGKFDLRRQSASSFWFYDYDPSWRKPYCYWQVPLTWVTIGLWQGLVPISYPCAGNTFTRQAAIEQVKTLAVVAGANLVVMTMKNEEDQVHRIEGILFHTTLETLGPSKKLEKHRTAGLVDDPKRRPRLDARSRAVAGPTLSQ